MLIFFQFKNKSKILQGSPTDLDSLLAFLCQMPSNKLTAPLIGKSAFNRHRKGLEFCPVIDGELIPCPVDQLRRQMDWPLEVIVGGTEFEALLFGEKIKGLKI
jgi:hypothetical protein